MKILVTGFEPFGGAVINPAYEAVKLLPDVIAGAEVIKIEIPTVFGRDEEVVRAAVEKHHPDAVLCVGQAGGRSRITGVSRTMRESSRSIHQSGQTERMHILRRFQSRAWYSI